MDSQDKNNDFFSAKEIDDLIILSLNKNLLIRSTDLTARDRVLDFFDDISRSDTINTDFHSRHNRQNNTLIKRSRQSPRFYRKAMEF